VQVKNNVMTAIWRAAFYARRNAALGSEERVPRLKYASSGGVTLENEPFHHARRDKEST